MTRLKMTLLPIFIAAIAISSCKAMDQLTVAYEWNILDYDFPSEQARAEAINSKEFIPENNIPSGIEVYKDRLFITVPRWKPGVPSSLNYIRLNNGTNKSPKLIPYPNWAAHRGQRPELASPYRVRADRCGRLWVPDPGFSEQADDKVNVALSKEPSLIVYDLATDELLRTYVFPADQMNNNSFCATLVVEDTSCEDTYVYIADVTLGNLLIYSWRTGSSWKITHHFFNFDPMATDFNLGGINFQWDDRIFGIALSAPGPDNYSTLYFHPMASFDEFSVSTRILRDPELAEKSFNEFKHLGNRGPNSQAGASFIDKKTGVLFYTLLNLNAVACWKTSNRAYTKESQGRIYMSNVTMVMPNDIKVDYDHNIWVVSNKMHIFLFSKLNFNEVNFRILMGSVQQAIKGTACDTNPDLNLINKIGRSMSTTTSKPGSATRNTISVAMLLLIATFIGLFKY